MKIETFFITGVAVRTSNAPSMTEKDIPQLRSRLFYRKYDWPATHKTGNDIYCVYIDYEKDYAQPYTTLLGCRVEKMRWCRQGLHA